MKHHPYIMYIAPKSAWIVGQRGGVVNGVFYSQDKATECIIRLKNKWNEKYGKNQGSIKI